MIVLDTDASSEFVKETVRGVLVRTVIRNSIVVLPFATIAELDHWVLNHGIGLQRQGVLEEFIERSVLAYPDRETCRTWAQVSYQTRRIGRRMSDNDAWIATTALMLDLPLLTFNRKHFEPVVGLHLIEP